jgi:hypothetical protein
VAAAAGAHGATIAFPGRCHARAPSTLVEAFVRPGSPPTSTDLHVVAEVVRRLDGMPLAIELAAGRLSTFSLSDLHARLDRALDLLGGGGPTGDARHRTLRATVEWSYRLLTDDEQRLFRHLAVFVDGVALDDAERLAADLGLRSDPGTVLSRLVHASMIEPEFTGGTRYRMLETLRAFGLDRLAAAGEDDDAARRLLGWAVSLVAGIATGLTGIDEPAADSVLRRELANLRAAWLVARRGAAFDEASALVTALFAGIGHRDLVEIRGWAEELAAELLANSSLAAHPAAAAVLGMAAEAVYQRATMPGPSSSPAPASCGRRTMRGPFPACMRCRWPSWPEAHTPTSSSTPSPRPRSPRGPASASGSPPWRRPTPATSAVRAS